MTATRYCSCARTHTHARTVGYISGNNMGKFVKIDIVYDSILLHHGNPSGLLWAPTRQRPQANFKATPSLTNQEKVTLIRTVRQFKYSSVDFNSTAHFWDLVDLDGSHKVSSKAGRWEQLETFCKSLTKEHHSKYKSNARKHASCYQSRERP